MMSATRRKEELLRLMQGEHEKLEAVLARLSEEQMQRGGVAGEWSVKDILAHLTWWEQAMISETVYGVELDPGLNGEPWSTDRANALMVEAKRNTPLAEVLREFHDSYRQTLHMVENLSEDDLADQEVYTHLANNTGNHCAEHRQMIEEWLKLKHGGYTRKVWSF